MPEDYVSLFVNSAFAQRNPEAALSLLFLFLARFLPIIALAPFFGARVLPHPVKLTFAISMFVIMLPQLVTVTTTPIEYDLRLVILMIKEFFVGLIMGYLIAMPFQIVQSAGIIIDHQRGGASLMVNDPTIQNQSSPLGTLFNMVLIFLFFFINGPFIVLDGVISSYELIPPDRFFDPSFFSQGSPFWDMQLKILNKVMVMTIQLASPALIAILMTDVFLGIANRLAPQVQITFLGMALKSLLALLVVCLGWKLYNTEVIKQSLQWLQSMDSIVKTFKII
jgi:type III secretion protein SpaR/YscT/HrcT